MAADTNSGFTSDSSTDATLRNYTPLDSPDITITVDKANRAVNFIKTWSPANIGIDSIDQYNFDNCIEITDGLPLYRRNDLWRCWSAPPSSRSSFQGTGAGIPAPPGEPENLCYRSHTTFDDNYFLNRHIRKHALAAMVESYSMKPSIAPNFIKTHFRYPYPGFLPTLRVDERTWLPEGTMIERGGPRLNPGDIVLPGIEHDDVYTETEEEMNIDDDSEYMIDVDDMSSRMRGLKTDNEDEEMSDDSLIDQDGDTLM